MPGLATNITIPNGGAKVKITLSALSMSIASINDYAVTTIWDGTVGSGIGLGKYVTRSPMNTYETHFMAQTVRTLSACPHTIQVGLFNANGARTVGLSADAQQPLYLLVERIG